MLRNRTRNMRPIHRVFRAAGYATLAGMVVLTAAVVLYAVRDRLDGGMPRFMGRHILPVLTEAMEPDIPQGSLIAIQLKEVKDLQPGDVVTVPIGQQEPSASLIKGDSFRVITWSEVGNVPEFVAPEAVVGEVSLVLPWLGYLLKYSQTRAGLIFVALMPLKIALTLVSGPVLAWVSKKVLNWRQPTSH